MVSEPYYQCLIVLVLLQIDSQITWVVTSQSFLMRTLTIKLTPQAGCLPLNILSGPSICVVNSNEKMFFQSHYTSSIYVSNEIVSTRVFWSDYFLTNFCQCYQFLLKKYSFISTSVLIAHLASGNCSLFRIYSICLRF